jgi:hypothetical protein
MPIVAKPMKLEEPKRKQGRSPAYPGIHLKKAIEQARALYDAHGKYAVPMHLAFSAWGYGSKSSGGRETRAALKYFGLIAIEGDTESGKIKLSEKALRVLLDQREDQSEKQALIREFALTPAIHKTLFKGFPDGITSDATVAHFLVFEEAYNESAAGELVEEFKATADYAKLYKPANVVDINSKVVRNPPKPIAKVGDLVQVEINGAFQLEKPKPVRAVQDYEGQTWVFVEDHEAGVPMGQVTVIEGGATKMIDPPRLPLEAPSDWREERLLDEAGEEIFLRYKGEPSKERYEFLRDYLDFKLKRMK